MNKIDEFSERIVQSGLVDEISAHEAFSDWRLAAARPDDVRGFADWMVENQLLTQMQAENVLAAVIQPERLGRYRLGEPVTSGQLGDVFAAIDTDTGQSVSIKMFRHAVDAEQMTRIHREARVSVQANHPHVVKTLGVGRNQTATWLVFEPLAGETLLARLERDTWLPHREACRVIQQVALGLHHLHSLGTVHRDVKPNNIWITETGVPKLLEFGSTRDSLEYLDRPADTEAGVTMLGGSVIGTFDYMPSEQALDSHAATERSDIYALGCVLYHALSGQPPFPDSHPVRQMMRHANEPPRPLDEIRQEIPPGDSAWDRRAGQDDARQETGRPLRIRCRCR